MDHDVADLIEKRKIPVYVVEEDVAARGIEDRDLIPGIRPLSRAKVPEMCAEYTIVSLW